MSEHYAQLLILLLVEEGLFALRGKSICPADTQLIDKALVRVSTHLSAIRDTYAKDYLKEMRQQKPEVAEPEETPSEDSDALAKRLEADAQLYASRILAEYEDGGGVGFSLACEAWEFARTMEMRRRETLQHFNRPPE